MDNERTSDLWTTRLAAATADATKRLQRRSPGWWRDAAPGGGGTRADRVSELVAALAALDPTARGRPAPGRPAHEAALADQLTVVAYDLRRAVEDGHEVDVEAVEAAVARCLRDVDPRR